MKDGINLLCPDGHRRHCFPTLAEYIGDYEEQRVVAGILNGYCPKCTIPSHRSHEPEHGLESRDFPKRDRDEAHRLRSIHGPRSKELKAFGYHHTSPFTATHPYSDIHDALAPDLLHQASKCFYDHIHQFVVSLIEKQTNSTKAKGEIDARFSHLPPYQNLRPFRLGINSLPRWTGKDYKAMAKVYLGVIKGLVPDECVEMVRHYLDVCRLAHYESHTESTLTIFKNSLDLFWKHLLDLNSVFIINEIVPIGWYTPKMHYLRHYPDYIRDKGALPYCSTDRTEPWHIPIKDSYRASNKGPQAAEFIVRDEARDHAWEVWEQGLRRRVPGLLSTLACHANEEDSFSEEDDVAEPCESLRDPIMKTVRLTSGRRWRGLQEISVVEEEITLSGLEECTRHFLTWLRQGRRPIRKRKLDDIDRGERLEIIGHQSAKLRYPTVHDPFNALTEYVYCTPSYTYHQNRDWTKSRFDTVIIRYGPEVDGLHSMANRRVARVLLLFKLVDQGNLPPYELAYVQLFTCSHRPDKNCGMYRLKKTEQYEVVELDTFERGVHLIPIFGKAIDTPMATSESAPALDSWNEFWLNNQTDLHVFNSIY